jgi:hypothetical protein
MAAAPGYQPLRLVFRSVRRVLLQEEGPLQRPPDTHEIASSGPRAVMGRGIEADLLAMVPHGGPTSELN